MNYSPANQILSLSVPAAPAAPQVSKCPPGPCSCPQKCLKLSQTSENSFCLQKIITPWTLRGQLVPHLQSRGCGHSSWEWEIIWVGRDLRVPPAPCPAQVSHPSLSLAVSGHLCAQGYPGTGTILLGKGSQGVCSAQEHPAWQITNPSGSLPLCLEDMALPSQFFPSFR